MSTSFTPNPVDLTESPYPFITLWINGRRVPLERIAQGQEVPRSAFEESTFDFIRAWMAGEENFEMTTSGSTGTPKNISVKRTQMVMSSRKTAAKIHLRKNSTALVCIDTRYIGGKMMLARSLALGLPMVAVDPCANPLIKIPIDICVQFTAFVPYQIRHILESKHPHLLNNLDRVLIGGAPLQEADRVRLHRFQCLCYETYGMTETVSHIALRLVNSADRKPHFELLPGIAISHDTRGCLVISADYLPAPVVTNDLVEIVGPHEFLWRGRWDCVINTGGVKVSPEKIEAALERIFFANGFHHRFFIAASPDDKLGSKVVLILEGVQFSSDLLKLSLETLKSIVTPYEFPKEVFSIAAFKTTGNQKVDRGQTLAGVTLQPYFKL